MLAGAPMQGERGASDEFTDERRRALLRDLEDRRLARDVLTSLLRGPDDTLRHAALLQLARRLRAGERLDAWQRMLPEDLLALPAESQLALAQLSIDGCALDLPEPPDSLPVAVRLGWLRARL